VKVVLIETPCWMVYTPPYALAMIYTVTKKAGYDTEVFDLNIEAYERLKLLRKYWEPENLWVWGYPEKSQYYNVIHKYMEPFLKFEAIKIEKLSPDVVGFSVFRYTALTSLILAQKIKELNSDIKTVFGGIEMISYHGEMRKEIEKSRFVDFCIRGEGEEAFLELLSRLKNNISHPVLPGVLTKLGSKSVYGGKRKFICDLDKLPFPNYTPFLKYSYTDKDVFPVVGSRGCPYRCRFCHTRKFEWNDTFRGRSGENIAMEIREAIKRFKAKEFVFNDLLMNGAPLKLINMCQEIVRNNLVITFGGTAIPAKLPFSVLKALRTAGCEYLRFGLESGSKKVLKDMNKNINPDEVAKIIKNCYRLGIDVKLNLMVGFPTETWLDFIQTVLFIIRYKKFIFAVAPIAMCNIEGELLNLLERFKIENPRSHLWRSKFSNFEIRTKRKRIMEYLIKKFNIDARVKPMYDHANIRKYLRALHYVDSPLIHYKLGLLYIKNKETEKAKFFLKKTIESLYPEGIKLLFSISEGNEILSNILLLKKALKFKKIEGNSSFKLLLRRVYQRYLLDNIRK